MESAERIVRTWMGSGRDLEIQETVLGISNGHITLLNVVKALGEYLTAEEDELRIKGVEFLSLVLEQCSSDKINRQSARVLVTFYCGKLDDTETIIPALKGLTTLASLSSCTSSDVEEIIRALFFHVKVKALAASNRFLVFSIIDSLMARQREALKSMRSEFISGYATLVEGEKDPRNLMTAFAITRVILIEFDIADHIEALFNITFCYFPISFRPPTDDPYGISPDDLKMALRSCLCATPLFGPLATPVYLEKLVAGSPISKRDTLQSMSVSFPVYGASLARESARKLWNSLKLEIFQPTDPITEEEALKTTQVLIRTIYADPTEHDMDADNIQGLALEVCEECIQILREPEKSQAKPAIKVLCAFISATPSISRYTISRVVPHLVRLFFSPDELSNRAPITILLAEVIAAARDLMAKSSIHPEFDIPLTTFKDEVLGVFIVGLKATSSRQPALAGLKAMVTTPTLLADEELGFVVHNVDDILQTNPDDDDDASSDDMLDLLSSISSVNPRHVEEQTLPLLFSSLPDKAPSRAATADRAMYWRILTALSKLCIQQELFEMLVIRLSTKLDLVCVPPTSSTKEGGSDFEPSAAYAHAILTTLANTLQTKVDLGHTDVPKYIDRLVSRLYNLFIYSALLSKDDSMVSTDPRVIGITAQIITLVVQILPIQRQEIFAAALFSAYLSGAVKGIAEGHHKISADKAFRPFDSTSPAAQRNLIALFAAGIIPLHKEVRIPVDKLDQFLITLTTWNASACDSLQIEGVWHILASVVNKRADDMPFFLSHMLGTFWRQEILDIDVPLERRRHAIRTWLWISKAFLVRGHPDAMQFVDRLFKVLGDQQVGWYAARAIGEIGGTDKILTKRNHASIRILYAQKFFNNMLPHIIEGGQSPQSHKQSAYLIALASLIKSMPETVYVREMPSLMPLLLRGLDLPDTEIRANVIGTFISAVGSDSTEHGAISEHASTLVSTTLKNSMASEVSSQRVRIAALRYLGILPNIVRYDVLHPYKSTVIRELAKVLDDPKRSVRKEAVDARTNWFKYNG